MKYKQWNRAASAPQARAAMEAAGVPPLAALTLCARGLDTPEKASAFLDAGRGQLLDPFLMKDMDRAAARVRRALAAGEHIAVYGDYDVDGITSTCLLTHYLRAQGGDVCYYIPNRLSEGYGVNREAVEELARQGVRLMITVDCGITAVEEVAYASGLGIDVIITDHHECKEEIPAAVAVVDPHRPDCPYPFKHLAGVGVALKLVLALGGQNREDALFARYCTLAAIGTVADVMRMEGENRTIVSCGLEALPHTDFVGIHALLKEAGLLGKPITSIQIGFVLSPRINAAGRMGAADLAADLLETDDPARAEELARQLCDLNRERQAVEQAICADAADKITHLRSEDRNALVLASEHWHQGVVGIVASRFNEFITSKLIAGAMDGLLRHNVREEDVDIAWVPGAFEEPLVAQHMARSGHYDAVICLGAVIRGATSHYDLVCNEVAKGIAQVALASDVPVMFGVVTTDTIEQAIERAGTKARNKGFDCAT